MKKLRYSFSSAISPPLFSSLSFLRTAAWLVRIVRSRTLISLVAISLLILSLRSSLTGIPIAKVKQAVTSDDVDHIVEADPSVPLLCFFVNVLELILFVFCEDAPFFIKELVEVGPTLLPASPVIVHPLCECRIYYSSTNKVIFLSKASRTIYTYIPHRYNSIMVRGDRKNQGGNQAGNHNNNKAQKNIHKPTEAAKQ